MKERYHKRQNMAVVWVLKGNNREMRKYQGLMAMAFTHSTDTLHDGRRLLVRLAVCNSHNSGMHVLLTLHPAVHCTPFHPLQLFCCEGRKSVGGHAR